MKSLRKKSTFLSETSIPGISHANVRTISGGGNFRRCGLMTFPLSVEIQAVEVARYMGAVCTAVARNKSNKFCKTSNNSMGNNNKLSWNLG